MFFNAGLSSETEEVESEETTELNLGRDCLSQREENQFHF